MATGSHELLEQYESRFARAAAELPCREPWTAAGRDEIRREVRSCLGVRDEWTPAVTTETVGKLRCDGFTVELLRAESWPGCRCAAHLYLPDEPAGYPPPLVFVLCGHGEGGKLHHAYQRMARAVTRRGAAALVPDNIGQGEREAMGHADCVAPFACGTSLQGLIVMETLGWLEWARTSGRFDAGRVAAVGNSGGGALGLFLAALSGDLAAVSSSGYPSTFDFVARKEKKHCHCNILPGVAGRLEMWHCLGAFTPRPMLIFQGECDPLFPVDLFQHCARKVAECYRRAGEPGAFMAEVAEGGHSWDAARRELVGGWLESALGLHEHSGPDEELESLLAADGRCYDEWPSESLTTDDVARSVTGVDAPEGPSLWDVYPPELPQGVPPAALDEETPRGTVRQIAAQFEAFLRKAR